MMKPPRLLPLLLMVPVLAHASDYRLRYFLNQILPINALSSSPSATDKDGWSALGAIYGCSNWTPSPTTVGLGTDFVQSATNCSQKQERIIDGVAQTRIVQTSSTQHAIGTLAQWEPTSPRYSDWILDWGPYSCKNWSPSSESVTTSSTFQQTATDCLTDQYREIYPQEKERYSGQLRDIPIKEGDYPDEEGRTLTNVTGQRTYTVALGEWADTAFVRDCTDWTPDASTVNKGVRFQQSAECKRVQERTRKETYVEPTSRNTITALNTKENRNGNDTTMTMPATGTKPFTECKFSISESTYAHDQMRRTYAADLPKQAYTERRIMWGNMQIYWSNKFFDDYETADYASFPDRVSYAGFDYYIEKSQGDGYYSICRE